MVFRREGARLRDDRGQVVFAGRGLALHRRAEVLCRIFLEGCRCRVDAGSSEARYEN